MSVARTMPAGARGNAADVLPASDAVALAPAHDDRSRPFQATQRPIPVRTVPRAAIEALVARLVASGGVESPTLPTGAP